VSALDLGQGSLKSRWH